MYQQYAIKFTGCYWIAMDAAVRFWQKADVYNSRKQLFELDISSFFN
jgi:hypothetical protein